MSHNLVTENDEPREALLTAIESRNDARERVAVASATLERAGAFVAQLEANLAQFDSVDARIAASRADAFKRALTEDEAMPALSLSAELSAASAKKLDAQNQLSGARQAYAALSAEYDETQGLLTQLQSAVGTAAALVVGAAADELAKELVGIEARAAALRARLMGATALRQGQSFRVAQSTVALLRDAPANGRVVNGSVADREHWDLFLARLTEDASASADNEF